MIEVQPREEHRALLGVEERIVGARPGMGPWMRVANAAGILADRRSDESPKTHA
jgi:hypothetical protein